MSLFGWQFALGATTIWLVRISGDDAAVDFGMLFAVLASGEVIGVYVGRHVAAATHGFAINIGVTCVLSAAVFLIGVVDDWYLLVCLGVVGLLSGLLGVTASTARLITTPYKLQGRVLGASRALILVGNAFGAFLVPLTWPYLVEPWSFALPAAVAATCTLGYLRWTRLGST